MERKRKRFLELLCDGGSVTQAAAAAKTPRRTLYDWRRSDAEFAREWDRAWEQGTDVLEEVAQDRAVNGSDLLLIFLLKARRPERYRDNVRHEVEVSRTVSVEDARAQAIARLEAIRERRRAVGLEEECPTCGGSGIVARASRGGGGPRIVGGGVDLSS